MTFSAFKGPFEERISRWNAALQVTSEVIDEWLKVQRSWLYLQPIFDSEDIMRQLPTETKRFKSVDRNWRSMMSKAKKNVKAIEFCNDRRLKGENSHHALAGASCRCPQSTTVL